jgi:hypothetical protein
MLMRMSIPSRLVDALLEDREVTGCHEQPHRPRVRRVPVSVEMALEGRRVHGRPVGDRRRSPAVVGHSVASVAPL